MITVKPCTVAQMELAPNLGELCAEYAQESAIEGLGPYQIQVESYRAMEAAGILHMVGAFDDDNTLVGFLSMLLTVLPHFGACTATSESFFVAAAYRRGGTGLKLLRTAQERAVELGAMGFFISAPIGGRLDLVLPGMGYKPSSHVFFKRLAP